MAREWKPGDVALHPDYGLSVVTERCGRHSLALGPHWHHAVGSWNSLNDPLSCGKYRPLVVIDPEDREQVARLANAITMEMYAGDSVAAGDVAAALREFANPTPPKPEEPTGLGAVVEDAEGLHWVRIQTLYSSPWVRRGTVITGGLHKWSDINAVKVLSEGVDAQ